MKIATCLSLLLVGLLVALLAAAGPALAWDGPVLWHQPADAANPGGGGIFGTGGARDYNITCEHCHVGRPPDRFIDAAVSFTPALGAGGTYAPGQSYQVRVDLLGEFQGLSGCGPYTPNVNNFAAVFEDAGGVTGTLTSDSGQSQSACPVDYPDPSSGTSALYRDCEVVFGRDVPGRTSWTFSWRAPAAGAGLVTMSYGVVDGDCRMMSMADPVKMDKLELGEASAAAGPPRSRGGAAAALVLVPLALVLLRRRAAPFLLLALVSCGGGDTREEGTLGGACLPGNVCMAGLSCVDDVCVAGGADASPGAPDADPAAPDADPNAPDAAPFAPVATINHPGDGEVRPAGTPVPFIGVATDPQDGALSGASLVWTSSLDGAFGTGESFDAPLSIGVHVITLTATDSDGNTGSDAIDLTIQ